MLNGKRQTEKLLKGTCHENAEGQSRLWSTDGNRGVSIPVVQGPNREDEYQKRGMKHEMI
jgi:hypothetical protein